MDNEMDEQVVYVKDLLFSVLYQWRKLLTVALILAVILGGGKGFFTWREANDPTAREESKTRYEAELAQYEKEKGAMEALTRELQMSTENKADYLANSVRMKLNPYGVYSGSLSLYVDTPWQIMPDKVYQDPDRKPAILEAYAAHLNSSQVMENVAKALGTEGKYLRELVKVEISDSFGITIQASYLDRAGAQQILALMAGEIDDVQSRIAGDIGEHTVEKVAENMDCVVDLNLYNTQKAERESLISEEEELTASLEALEKMEAPKQDAVSGKTAVAAAVKYGAVGGVLGIFMVAAIACIAMAGGDKVYSAVALNRRFRVKILGNIGAPCKSRIDRWLKRKEGRALEEDRGLDLLTANVKNRVDGLQTLLVTGDADESLARLVAEALRPALQGVEIRACGSLLRDPEALAALPACDGVLLAEQCKSSRYSRVARELELAADGKKPVLGCVVFE